MRASICAGSTPWRTNCSRTSLRCTILASVACCDASVCGVIIAADAEPGKLKAVIDAMRTAETKRHRFLGTRTSQGSRMTGGPSKLAFRRRPVLCTVPAIVLRPQRQEATIRRTGTDIHHLQGETMKKIWTAGAAVLLVTAASMALAQAPAKQPAPAAKGDPKVHECRMQNQKEHQAVMQMHAQGLKEHKISAGEEKAYRAMEGRLHQHQAALAKDGLTLAECQQLGKQIASEKAAVTRMAAT